MLFLSYTFIYIYIKQKKNNNIISIPRGAGSLENEFNPQLLSDIRCAIITKN